MCEPQPTKQRPTWYTPYIIAVFTITLIIGITLLIIDQTNQQLKIFFLIVVLIAECAAFYGRIKPSLTLNRIMYILLGIPIGFILWLVVWRTLLNIHGSVIGNNPIYVLGSMAICLTVGGFVGELIGRHRHYKGPQQYQI